MAERQFWLRAEQIRPLIPNRGGCIASDRITVDGKLVGYMYRGEPANKSDNGWRFLAGDESPEYMADLSKHTVYDVNTIANHDPAIIPLLDSPEGSAYIRDWETYEFVPDDPSHKTETPEPSEIDVTGSNDEVARWIWKTLIPKSGQASFVQAEVLRAIEKLRWEAQGNGNINWDDRFEMLADFIETTLCSQQCFSDQVKQSIRHDVRRLTHFLPPNELTDESRIPELPYVEDDLYDRLADHLISWCRQNPALVPYTHDPDQYR